MILAKVALGLGVSMAAAGAYVFHEGVIRVDVDEHRDDGTHLHVWLPATLVATGLHFASKQQLQEAAEQARPYLPVIREVTKELEKYPEAEFVSVNSATDQVRVAVSGGKLQIDALTNDGDVVHVSVPAQMINDVADELERRAPGV